MKFEKDVKLMKWKQKGKKIKNINHIRARQFDCNFVVVAILTDDLQFCVSSFYS